MPGEASNPLVIAGVVLVVVALAAWAFTAHRKRQRALGELLERLGFRPCPAEQGTLEGIVKGIVNDRDHRYLVEQPQRLAGVPAIYYYVKVRDTKHPDEQRDAGEELLFRLRRRSPAAALLFVKPSSLAPGLATRLISSVAAGPWSTQPDDLKRLELPADLKDTNLLAALGPEGASLYDVVDAKLLSVIQGLGDAGGMIVRLRDDWCVVEAASHQVPFRIDEIVARMRPLL
jgi:hypothetical protein